MNYIKYKIIHGAIPFGLKKKMIRFRTYSNRLPYAIAYGGLQNLQVDLQRKIDLLPALIDPQVFWVELSKIEYQGLVSNKKGKLSFPGNWDTQVIYPYVSVFEELPQTTRCWDIHETIRSIFLFGKDYQLSPQYKSMINCLKEKRLSKHFKVLHSIEDIHGYFNRLQAAYHSMQKHGFLTQKEQGKLNEWEIEIYVTRSGKLCIGCGGNHRIRMAELVGFRFVPVIIKGIHPLWIETLVQQYSLQPHQAVQKWLQQSFYLKKPEGNKSQPVYANKY